MAWILVAHRTPERKSGSRRAAFSLGPSEYRRSTAPVGCWTALIIQACACRYYPGGSRSMQTVPLVATFRSGVQSNWCGHATKRTTGQTRDRKSDVKDE